MNILRKTLALLLVVVSMVWPGWCEARPKVSKPIESVLRQPLPPEELSLTRTAHELVINGPTFTYTVGRTNGAITGIRAAGDRQELIASTGAAEIEVDGYRLSGGIASAGVEVVSRGKDKVVLRAGGVLGKNRMQYELLHTFFNDGVVVSNVKLTPRQDLLVTNAIAYELPVQGALSHYLHKRRDEHGDAAVRGSLPEPGKAFRTATLTSCLQVFSPLAALAIFTDSGATHLSRQDLDTARVEVTGKQENGTRLCLTQYLVHVAAGDQPYRIKAGEEFSFRVGISVAPNRVAHPRMHDLRMFAWIGDTNYPYATDQEIAEVAQVGYTVFQMHRLGTPGEPRPPNGELERVIKKVHDSGMLFLWTENADLMYDSAPGVQEMKAAGKWALWEGFNYDGRYQATMDPYCDLAATCLASPNGLAEYRAACIRRMMERYDVDGMYVDDNLGYPNCTRWREHGHPRPVYDCLIELHEMNWRRRELLRGKCPHAVLVSHNTRAIILPAVCDFDAQLYGEGYSFGSLENYWEYYVPVKATPAQGMIWPGGQDPVRCGAAIAYNYDLLTGGGRYCEIDWRLFPKKFPYAQGVLKDERLYVQTYNLAQYYFGLHESKPYCFADSTNLFAATSPLTYATIYRNQVWPDWLIVVANMRKESGRASVVIRAHQELGLESGRDFVLFQTERRTASTVKLENLSQALSLVMVPGEGLRLWSLRQMPVEGPCHVWGGKRISEAWNSKRRKLTLAVQGPAGLQDSVFIRSAQSGVQEVKVAGKLAAFFYDPVQGLVHGKVTFTPEPMKIEVLCSANGANALSESPVPASPLGAVPQ